jgi:hypothetical protein
VNAAARVTLADLLAEDSLERVPIDSDVVANLLRQAANHLRTSKAGAPDDPEGAFQLAYDSCRKTCLALVLATGLRPKGDGHHATTFDAAGEIAKNFGGRSVVIDAANLRYVRHGAEYRAEAVTPDDVDDAIAIGEELLDQLVPSIEKILESAVGTLARPLPESLAGYWAGRGRAGEGVEDGQGSLP